MALHPPRNQSLQDHRGGPQLRSGAGCQGGGLVKDVDAEGGFVAGPVDVGTSGVVLGDGPLDDAGCDADAPVGEEVVQDEAADLADQVDNGLGDDTGGLHELVAGGVQGDGEAGPVGVDAGLGAGGVGHGQAEDLVAHQQGVDLLVDAGGGAGAQDSSAEGGGQPVDPGAAAGAGGDGDLGLDHTDLGRADLRQPGAVWVAAQHRQLAVAFEPHQQVRLGGGDRFDQFAVVEVAVQQHDHAGLEAAQQPTGIAWLAAAGGAKGRVDDRAGAAGHQGQQPQQRIPRAAVVAGLLGEPAQVGRGVGHADGG